MPSPTRTLKLTLAYDGTAYAGWQRQENAPTIQGRLEAALAEVEGRPVVVHGAGRTDAGVHALGQAASLKLAHPIETTALGPALNAKLPKDIRVLAVQEMPADFHARYAASGKTYRYRIDRAPVASPFERRYAWHVPRELDLAEMRRAARGLVGRHDFAAFQTHAPESGRGPTVRTLFDLAIDEPLETLTTIEVRGDGFLRHMVRALVGTLVEVGAGRRPVGHVAEALASARRSRAGPTAPARGLFLVRVDYPEA